MKVHNPGNTKPIDELFVVVSRDEQGREGIIAGNMGLVGVSPFVTSEPKTAALMLEVAKESVKPEHNLTVHLNTYRKVQ